MNRKVLLLNQGETLVDIIDWRVAVCLLVKGNARIPYGYEDCHRIPISQHSAEKMRESGEFDVEFEEKENRVQGYFLLPTALILVEYVHLPYKTAAINKKNLLKRDGYKCGYCERQLTNTTGTIDHIVPQSRWKIFKEKGLVKGKSAHDWRNVVAACRYCNCRKDNKTPEEAGMKLKLQPFIPSKDYLILHGVDLKTYETWKRWVCFDDLK